MPPSSLWSPITLWWPVSLSTTSMFSVFRPNPLSFCWSRLGTIISKFRPYAGAYGSWCQTSPHCTADSAPLPPCCESVSLDAQHVLLASIHLFLLSCLHLVLGQPIQYEIVFPHLENIKKIYLQIGFGIQSALQLNNIIWLMNATT